MIILKNPNNEFDNPKPQSLESITTDFVMSNDDSNNAL